MYIRLMLCVKYKTICIAAFPYTPIYIHRTANFDIYTTFQSNNYYFTLGKQLTIIFVANNNNNK